MNRQHTRLMSAAAVTLFATLGCGADTGTLSLKLTDAPPDTENMSAVMISLARVDVHVAGARDDDDHEDGLRREGAPVAPDEKQKEDDDGGWHTLERAPMTFDLLRLQNGVTEALGDFTVPTGKITQIRLFIDKAGRNEVQLKSGGACPLDLRAVDQGGVKINHPFKAMIEGGQTTEVVVDFDLKESISKDAECTYRLHPVIKLKSVKS